MDQPSSLYFSFLSNDRGNSVACRNPDLAGITTVSPSGLGTLGGHLGVPLRLHVRPFSDTSTRLPDLWKSFLTDLDSSWEYFPYWRATLVYVSTLPFGEYLTPSRKRLGMDLHLHCPLDHRPALALPTSFRLKHLPRACSRPYQGNEPDRRSLCQR